MNTNEDIIKAVSASMPEEYAQKLAGLSSEQVFGVMTDFPHVANSFISTLTNKVTKSLIYSKIFNNPLKFLKKDKLEYGDSIEQLFVEMAQVKGFTGHWIDETGANTPEADLIRKLAPEVEAMYITLNVDYKLKTTVFDKALKKAFFQEGGLSNLIGQIVGSITSSAEFKEFTLMKDVYEKLISEGKQIKKVADDGTVEFGDINVGTSQPIKKELHTVKIEGATKAEKMKNLSEAIRETVGYMKFPSKKYNLADKLVWSNPDEMMLITTPTTIAKMDVNVLADAFNMSKTDLNTRTIQVDSMPDGIFKNSDETGATVVPVIDKTRKPIAVLMSNDFLQIRDTFQGAGTFHNPEGLYTNHFANREGLFATCLFENITVFYEE